MKNNISISQIIAVTPAHLLDPQIAIAACRAGAMGVLDLGLHSNTDAIKSAIEKLDTAAGNNPWGLRVDFMGSTKHFQEIAAALNPKPHLVILAGLGQEKLAPFRKKITGFATRFLLEVNDISGARDAQKAGFDGVIIKGCEAGGHVGVHSSFVLLQQLHGQLDIPYWLQGGIGLHTGAAVCMSGAAGVVLGEQLWLTREGPYADSVKEKFWSKLDGSETMLLESPEGNFRLFNRAGRPQLKLLTEAVARGEEWLPLLDQLLTETSQDDPLIPLGQSIALTAFFGAHYGTTGRVIRAFRETIAQRPVLVKKYKPLAHGSSLAREHGTEYPIVQGPMAQVSDNVPFVEEVAKAGGLPFLAVGLLEGEDVRALLVKAADRLAGMSWGVGLLGFIPLAQRQEQLAVVKEFNPPFALIAGGRPGQAAELEASGIKTYLHAPSAGLLEMFIKEGARKFVFEGNEAGGHIGPRTCFVLWELAIHTLLAMDIEEPESIHILFAGGIHDSLSAAVIARLAAPLTARGMKVGVQMGSAYLFSEEAVNTGAILPEFQAQALKCQQTTILRSAHGHATRCARTPYCDFFSKTRNEMVLAGKSEEEILENLERLNSGRLRIAAKGITRNPDKKTAASGKKYIKVKPDKRVEQGLFMLGDISSLRNKPLSIAELHAEIATGCSGLASSAHELSRRRKRSARSSTNHDIAIVGMASLFPGAKDVRSYWENIVNRFDAIREVPEKRWRIADFYDPDRLAKDKIYAKWGGFLDDIQFDPIRYGIPPASLRSVEPMQLLALEVARQAMEDAGLDHLNFSRDRMAVIFGSGGIQDKAINYIFRTMLSHYLPGVDSISAQQVENLQAELQDKLQGWTEDSFPGVLANVVAGRVANRLNLHGSNFTVDAACASSLAALDVGISKLRSGEVDMALVGAADGTNNAVSFMAFAKTHALSPQGRCRAFDDSADGIAISEGVAAMVLKRLDDAESDGDRIYAVIKGIGSSSDGRNRSLTAPHPQGQVMAVQRAYEDAGISPATVELVEAHGTGTAAGDKAEIESLCLAFGSKKGKFQTCAVGSVKSMIGHTKVAAGMASVLKGVMAMQHQVLPPTIGVTHPNTHVDFSHTPFYINSETRPWFKNRTEIPRRCGISAFGFGGSNFHAVLEEYTGNYRTADVIDSMPRSHEIFCWSRADLSLLGKALTAFAGKLQHPGNLDLSQLAASLFFDESYSHVKEDKNICRLAIVAASVAELLQKLGVARGRFVEQKTDFRGVPGIYYNEKEYTPESVSFLFPGQGSQKLNMLRELVTGNVSLHPLFEKADELLQGQFPQNLSRYIYPLPVFTDEELEQQESLLKDTRVAQPALGVVDLTAFDLLDQYNLHPAFVAGHSYGEYVALCAAGTLSRDDLIRLSEIRGRLVAQASESTPGAMAAVKADGKTVREAIKKLKLSVIPANFNAPDQTVVAGTVQAVEDAVIALNREDLQARKIPVTAAFHTAAMQEAADKLLQELQKTTFHPGSCEVYSNTTTGRYPKTAAAKRKLLGRHMVEPVRFADQVEKMYNDGARIFVEVGPGRVLSSLVDRILPGQDHVTLSIDMPGRTGWEQLAHLLSQAITLGLPIKFSNWFKDRGLKAVSVDAVIEQSNIEANPDRHIWRINGGGVEPWNEAISSVQKETIQFKTQNNFLENKMKKILSQQNVQPLQTKPATADSLQVLIQNNMAQFMDLQRQQLEITRQFLDMQEKLLGAALGTGLPAAGGPPPVVPSANMPPPPKMPGLKVTPSTGTASPAPASTLTATPPAAASQDVIPEQFQSDLLQAVSERTGYPEEMLDLDANLEADLGIDSIKKVEIFNSLKHHHDLLEGTDEETLLEELVGMRTLRRIIEWHKSNQTRAEVEPITVSKKKNLTPTPLSKPEKDEIVINPDTADHVGRYVVTTVPSPLLQQPDELRGFPEKHLILLVGEAPAISAGLHAALSGSKYRVRQLIPGRKTQVLDKDRVEVDFSSLKSMQALHDLLTSENDTVGAVFNLMGLAPVVGNGASAPDDAAALFLLIKVLEKDLQDSAGQGGGWLVNFTCLDGLFGLGSKGQNTYQAAGTIGVVKSAAREWPWLRAKSIDIDADMDPHMLVAQILSELAAEDAQIEVGFTGEGRWSLKTEKVAPELLKYESIGLDHDAVILVTGGARGITAEVCRALAEQYKPRLILVGSSKLPGAESEATKHISRAQDIRQHFIKTMQAANAKVKPAEIEKRLTRLLQNREIRNNIEEMEKMGAQVEYHSLDIRDDVAFGQLIEDIYEKWNRIDGVIHGAGRIDDKLIRHKSLASFSTVFDTKVRPAEVMAAKLRPESLKFLVFFSSVAARFGNIGQSDYSAANEVLNKLADQLNGKWAQTRVVSINWGPWASGMVSDELCKMYSEKGIELVPVDTGVKYCLAELQLDRSAPAEVLISASVKEISEWGLGKA